MDHIAYINIRNADISICKPNTETNDKEGKKMKEVYP